MATSLFTQPIVSPGNLTEEQRIRAAALVVAKDVLGQHTYPDAIVNMAVYIVDGLGAYANARDSFEEREARLPMQEEIHRLRPLGEPLPGSAVYDDEDARRHIETATPSTNVTVVTPVIPVDEAAPDPEW